MLTTAALGSVWPPLGAAEPGPAADAAAGTTSRADTTAPAPMAIAFLNIPAPLAKRRCFQRPGTAAPLRRLPPSKIRRTPVASLSVLRDGVKGEITWIDRTHRAT